MQNNIKQLSPEDAEKCIEKIKNIDLKTTSVDLIKEMLVPLWLGFSLDVPILRPGELFHRGVILKPEEKRPDIIGRVSYAEPKYVTKYGRVNREGEPRFYASNSRATTLYEIGASPGQYIVISRWSLKESLIAVNIGYIQEVFNCHNSNRNLKDIWWHRSNLSEINNVLQNFFSKEFSKHVPDGEEHLYKISIAIAEGLFGNTHFKGELPSDIKNPPKERRLGILLYPSLARSANTDNVVLLPEFVDKYLELRQVDLIYVKEKFDEKNLKIDFLDFANSFTSDGRIEWQGRIPHWEGKGNFNWTFTYTDNGLVARNEKGEIVEPI